ncbi:MAG: gliding motility-associated C-terminal domain-containing protein, partial [Phaeodactylibacter sp.]|nr:gliding motility-associated C-terminal domain-containing protein [Phaeodactylibacter sp.]
EAEVIVIADSTKISIMPSDTVVCSPEEVCLTAESPAAECIIWTNLTGDTLGMGGTLCVIPAVGLNTYIASIPGLGCVEADTATVKLVPDSLAVSISPSPAKLCVGDTACLVATVGPDASMAMVTWFDESGAEVGTGFELCVSPASAGTYTYTAVADNGCSTASAEAEVIVIADSTKLEITPDVTYWCEIPEEVCLTAEGAAPECIMWSDLAGNVLGMGAELCVTPPFGVSQYVAFVPGLACVEGDTATIVVDTIPPVLPVLPDPAKICLGDTLKLDVSDVIGSYTWQDSLGTILASDTSLYLVPLDTGSFSIIFELSNGCGTVRDTITAVVVDSTKIEIQWDPEEVLCQADTVCLTAIAPASECIVWSDLAGNPIDTGAQLCVYLEPGMYTYVASIPGLDCIESDTTTITVLPDSLNISIGLSATAICEGDDVVLTAVAEPAWAIETVSWYDSGFNLIGTGLSIVQVPLEGLHTYYAVAENGCASDTAEATVMVEALNLEIFAEPGTICAGDSSLLRVVGCPECEYIWTPSSSLDDPTIDSPIATPAVTTTYTVTVFGAVCVDTLDVTVTVEDCPECLEKFFVATGFRPDGGPMDIASNNVTCLRSEYLNDFEKIYFIIYNRWGQEMFRYEYEQSSGQAVIPEKLCWDGQMNGKLLPPDVYGYYVEVKCPDSAKPTTSKGNITLLR